VRPLTVDQSMTMNLNCEDRDQLLTEFDRQVQTLIHKGYPEAGSMSVEEFLALVEPLRARVVDLDLPEKDIEKGCLPFVMVIKSDLVATETAMSLVEREGKRGITKLYPREPQDFHPIESVRLPGGIAYLLVDIDRGKESINVVPNEALTMIQQQNRSPLTIDEGIAVVTHYPEFLIKNNCFSLLASRHPADQRVPAIWINSEKRSNLGWCWAGNPHTWLGSASCASRIGL